MDFESLSNVIDNKIKKPRLQLSQEQSKKKKSIEHQQVHSSVVQVTHTVHVAQIHHPPPCKTTIISSKKSPKLSSISVHKKKKIESSSDYETQSQSTNSESDDVDDKKLTIAEFTSASINLDTLEPTNEEIIAPKQKIVLPKKSKTKIISTKEDIKSKLKPMIIPKPVSNLFYNYINFIIIINIKFELKLFKKTRYTAYMLWSKEMRQELLKDCPTMGKDLIVVHK
jgi:hypothetical protein